MLAAHPLFSKLDRALSLNGNEREALIRLPLKAATIRADQDVVREGDHSMRCLALTKGLLATSKTGTSGKRQIMAFHIPGDMPDLQGLHLETLDSDIRTLSECEVVFIEHAAIHRLCNDSPRIAAALWKMTLVDASIFREWVVNVGQRTGPSRLAHVFCEMMLRMETAKLSAIDGSCGLALTQSQLGEATGLSTVHINRSMQTLRTRGLLSFDGHHLTIHDWDGLAELADFRADYLHLGSRVELAN